MCYQKSNVLWQKILTAVCDVGEKVKYSYEIYSSAYFTVGWKDRKIVGV